MAAGWEGRLLPLCYASLLDFNEFKFKPFRMALVTFWRSQPRLDGTIQGFGADLELEVIDGNPAVVSGVALLGCDFKLEDVIITI